MHPFVLILVIKDNDNGDKNNLTDLENSFMN